MKYIAYFESNPEDTDKILVKYNEEILKERREYPERYSEPLSPNYSITIGRGFRLYEGTEEQLINLSKRWIPEIKIKYVAIFESVDLFEGMGT